MTKEEILNLKLYNFLFKENKGIKLSKNDLYKLCKNNFNISYKYFNYKINQFIEVGDIIVNNEKLIIVGK